MHYRHPRHWLMGVALAVLASAAPALAGAVAEVPAAMVAAPSAYPGSGPGEMRSWVQLVWDPVKQELARLSYTAWDPIPSLGLELQWRPDDPASGAAGPLSGSGTLLFRKKGAPSYDQSADVAQYRGSFVAGRANGEGSWLDLSGYGYEGAWQDGLMHGRGRLLLPNGDEYSGMFAEGRREGPGVYIDSTGAIFDGHFDNGLREGEGIFVPARGEPYRADWLAGDEVAGTRSALDPAALDYVRIVTAQYQDDPALRVGLVAERRPHNFELGIEPMSYTSRSDGARLDIFPDDQRLMDVWRNGAPIELTTDELIAFSSVSEGFTPSFLGNFERFEPLSLVFELENISTDAVAVVGGFLDVTNSARQPEPAVQMRPDHEHDCGTGIWFRPGFFLDNFGWGTAENARLNFAFGSTDGRVGDGTFSKDLGGLDGSARVDLTAELDELGVNTGLVAEDDFICTDRNDRRLCLGEIRQSGRYGTLSEFIALGDSVIEAKVSGTLDYDWTGADGSQNHKSAPFSSVLQLGHLAYDVECGEGGEIIPLKHDPFMLKLDQQNYKIAIPFSGEVTPGFTMRWRIEMQAPETSEHDFQLVLVLSDGRQLASRPVHLTYFIPPVREIPAELIGY